MWLVSDVGEPVPPNNNLTLLKPVLTCVVSLVDKVSHIIPGHMPLKFNYDTLLSGSLSANIQIRTGFVGGEWIDVMSRAPRALIGCPTSALGWRQRGLDHDQIWLEAVMVWPINGSKYGSSLICLLNSGHVIVAAILCLNSPITM